MKDPLPSTYWMGVKYEMLSLQSAAKPMIYALKIPSMEKGAKIENEWWRFEYKLVLMSFSYYEHASKWPADVLVLFLKTPIHHLKCIISIHAAKGNWTVCDITWFYNMSFKVTLPFSPLLIGANLISNAVSYLTAVPVREDVCVQYIWSCFCGFECCDD